MAHLPFLDADTIEQLHHYPSLIKALEQALRDDGISYPLRHHHEYDEDNTLLIMPSWEEGRDVGIKLVTVTPENRRKDLPSIQGVVVYFDAQSGSPLALLDAAALTRKRTAAASALASQFLSRINSRRLLVLGTGALAPELIRAHASSRPIEEVLVWGRTVAKARQLVKDFADERLQVRAVEDYVAVAPSADIISTATMATEPLLYARHLQAGQHLDLVGSYKKHMREASDDAVRMARLFVDNRSGALQESGDLYLPLQAGVISEGDVQAELRELCSGGHPGRTGPAEITLFKSVGFALEDLVAARFYYQRYLSKQL